MVDISQKEDVIRVATAIGTIKLKPETIKRIRDNKIEKGNVIAATKIAVIAAVKRTPDILPLCHPIPISNAKVDIKLNNDSLEIMVTVKSIGKTGVEMEALTGVAVGLLNVWDMVKKYEKDEMGQYPTTRISDIHVVEKTKTEVQ
ncbi:MAG: cyclic pyranopterin monophosphate synthase MoaC [Candidatus Asgardarchaeia archaeon]